MQLCGWALIQYNLCPYEKGSLGHKHIQRKDHMKMPEEDGHLPEKERDFSKN